MKKYTLDEIKEIITDPSFDYDDGSYGYAVVSPERVMMYLEGAIEYHEKLSNADDGEGF